MDVHSCSLEKRMAIRSRLEDPTAVSTIEQIESHRPRQLYINSRVKTIGATTSGKARTGLWKSIDAEC
jgi:hypothetical protein